MKFSAAATSNWLARQELRLAKIKLWHRRKNTTEFTVLKVRSASLVKRKAKHLFLRYVTKKDNKHLGTFQEAIGPVLVLAQVLALMPVAGVTSSSAKNLQFSWRNLRTFYSILVVACFGVTSGFMIAFTFHSNFTFDSVEIAIFYTSICIIACEFLNLARRWPKLMVQWQDIENKLPPLRTQMAKSWLANRIKMIALVVTMCSLGNFAFLFLSRLACKLYGCLIVIAVEHLLSMLSLIYYVNACPVLPDNLIESYLYSNFQEVFYFVEYHTLVGIVGKLINLLSTFAWNFNDIFVMIISTALAARFRQLNEHMLSAIKRPTTEQFWMDSRVNYRNLCKLCDAVDNTISYITLLCFSNNLYFICGKILKSLQKKRSLTHTVYFWYSLTFLLGRTFILSIFAADINEESKRPLIIFRSVTRAFWGPELKRFSEEVTTDIVALSGMKFFHLTRGLVLSVAGTIVTYELVMLQFNKLDHITDCFEH